MGKDGFREFVKKNPNLVDYVINNKMTWQQFYEIYDLYGEDNSIWNNFKNKDNNIGNTSLKDILSIFKGIDLKTIQKTLTSLSKAIDIFKDVNNKEEINNYEERPKYKYFED